MDLKKRILLGDFQGAREKMNRINPSEVRDTILEIGFDDGSILPYSFLCFCLCQEESSQIHYLASELLTTALCHLPGAYACGLFHTRRAIEFSPDEISLKEHLLLFHDIPEKLVSTDEARLIAKEIMLRSPDSMAAKSILGI